ncbi:unnamed protein product [Lathyrus sativus]|nr:unnamed protein product [Lathyrus sativus]
MDSGNSGSISSSGDEEYDSRTHHPTLLPSNFFNQQQPSLQFHSISHNPQSFHLGSNSNSNSVSFFDLSPNYLQNLPQSQPNIDTSSFPPSSQGLSSSSSLSFSLQQQQHSNQCLLTTPQALGLNDNNNNNARTTSTPSPSPATTNNATRNSKKRTRASRRAPTTVLTTDTSNFRAMVQEFTGIPAPPFSGSSYSRRLDLLTSSSSLRSSNSSHHFDPTATTTTSFYPLRPSPQKLYHQNPLLLSSSSSSPHNNNMVDATVNNNYHQQLPISDLGLPYNNHQQQQQHNFMLSMQNQQPIHTFNNLSASSSQQFHPFSLGAFGAKSQQQQQQTSLSVQSLEDLGVNQGQVNAHVGGDKVVGSSSTGGGVGSNCKVNFSGSGSITLNHEKTMENNNNNNDNSNNSNRGVEGVDSWICSSD